jgi:hypothetical protein
MALPVKPNVVYHADWGIKDKKRWCAKAVLRTEGRYTALAPEPVGDVGSFITRVRTEAGRAGCAFVGFDFPIGIPVAHAERAGISKFRDLLPQLGHGEWKDFYSVCDEPGEVSMHRPFYPNGKYKGRRREALLRGLDVSSIETLLRRCERGGNGRKQACCLFWTLGSNQVGKAAIIGWRDVLAPALEGEGTVSLWPFDGALPSLLAPGSVAIAETWPAECYGWFSEDPLGSKRNKDDRRRFGSSLLLWAGKQNVRLESQLRKEIQDGFQRGDDDAFDAVVGLLGMLQVCLGQRATGEPDELEIQDIEGWILGRAH